LRDGLRRDVALSNRILHAAGLVTAYGHASARIPSTETFLMPTRSSPALADEERLLVLDLEGRVVEGQGTPNKEVWIHARIYAARPDVGSVVHVHSPACVVLGQIGWTVRPLHNAGATLGLEIPLFERVGLIVSRELGDEVAEVLGERKAMLLRGHGANVAADTVQRATVLACLLEEAAELQLRALAVTGPEGKGVRFFDESEVALALQQQDAATTVERAWEYYTALATGRL
jgi:ribulose-5-phosphate 4-epimerase/fuculose-1-phosphate aldolase